MPVGTGDGSMWYKRNGYDLMRWNFFRISLLEMRVVVRMNKLQSRLEMVRGIKTSTKQIYEWDIQIVIYIQKVN